MRCAENFPGGFLEQVFSSTFNTMTRRVNSNQFTVIKRKQSGANPSDINSVFCVSDTAVAAMERRLTIKPYTVPVVPALCDMTPVSAKFIKSSLASQIAPHLSSASINLSTLFPVNRRNTVARPPSTVDVFGQTLPAWYILLAMSWHRFHFGVCVRPFSFHSSHVQFISTCVGPPIVCIVYRVRNRVTTATPRTLLSNARWDPNSVWKS